MLTKQQIIEKYRAIQPRTFEYYSDIDEYDVVSSGFKRILDECYDEKGKSLVNPVGFLAEMLNKFRDILLQDRKYSIYCNILESIIDGTLPALLAHPDKYKAIDFYKGLFHIRTDLSQNGFSGFLIDGFLQVCHVWFFKHIIKEIYRLVTGDLKSREITDSEEALIIYFFSALLSHGTDMLGKQVTLVTLPGILNRLKALVAEGYSLKIYNLFQGLSTLYVHQVEKLTCMKRIQFRFLHPKKVFMMGDPQKKKLAGYWCLSQFMPKEVAYLAAVEYLEYPGAGNMNHFITQRQTKSVAEIKFLPFSSTSPQKRLESVESVKQEIIKLTQTQLFKDWVDPAFKIECKAQIERFKDFTDVQKWLAQAISAVDECSPTDFYPLKQFDRDQIKLLGKLQQLQKTIEELIAASKTRSSSWFSLPKF